MKKLFAPLAAALLMAPPLFAQEKPAAAPAPHRLELAPAEPVGESLPLIPETPATVEKPKGMAIPEPKAEKEKKSQTEISADELQQRIRFRAAKTRALKDPAVQAEWDRANGVRTDLEKREALKSYYKLLYGRMAKIDGSLKKRIDFAQARSLRRLEQTRIDPTEPLERE